MERNRRMKPLKGIMLFLVLLFILSLTGCGNKEHRQVKRAVVSEFGQLKDLDTATVQKYLASENLFPDASTSQASSDLIEGVTSQFFKYFDYKILKIHTKEDTASCHMQIVTLDAHALAKDYQKEYLTQVIMSAAKGQASPDTSLEQHYLLLKKLMDDNTYPTVYSSCDIELVKKGKDWNIQKDLDLENQLVGGFISVIANPYLLNAKETVCVYFDTLKKMDPAQMSTYLGLNDIFNNSDADSQALAQALFEQMRACFDYEVVEAQDNGSVANVDVEMTSFSYTQILSTYTKGLESYLSTTDALIDGPSGRLARSNELLIDAINNNTATETHLVPLTLINDGVSWKLRSNDQIGSALFGDLNADTASSSLSNDTNGR